MGKGRTSTGRPWPVGVTIAGGLALVALIIAATAAMVLHSRERALADGERELGNIALVLAEQMDRSFQALDLVQRSVQDKIYALGISSPDDFRARMSSAEMLDLLREKAGGLVYLDSAALIDADGFVLNSSRGAPASPINLRDRDYFLPLKYNYGLASWIGEPVHARASGNWVIPFGRRLSTSDGQFLGVALCGIELSGLQDFFGSISLGSQSSVSLYRGDGVLLARFPQQEGMLGKTFHVASKALEARRSATTRYTGVMEGKERILAAHRLPTFPLYVSISLDTSAALASWRRETRLLLGAGALIALIAGTMFFLVAWHIMRRERWGKGRLAVEKQRLTTAVNHMSQALLLFDSDERLIICNDRYLEMYGLSPEIVKPGCRLLDLLQHRTERGDFTADPAAYRSELLEKIRSGKRTETVRAIGDGRWIHIVNLPTSDGGWVSTHEDISAAKRSEASFRLLFDSNPLPMWVYELDTLRFLAVNNAAVNVYGYSREKFLQMSLLDIRPKEDHNKVKDTVQSNRGTLAGEAIWRHRKADGGEIEVAIYSQPMDYEGRRASLTVVINETARRQAERERDRDRAFLHQILDNIPVMITVKDAATGRFLLANRAAEAIWQRPRKTVIGKTAREAFELAQAEIIEQHDQAALQSDQPVVLNAHPQIVSQGNRRMVVTKRFAIRDAEEQPQYLISVVEDVTERKLLETERDQQRDFLNALIDTVPVSIIAKNAGDRKYVLINRTAEEYLGIERDHILGRTAHEVWPASAAALVDSHDDRLLESGGGALFFEEHVLDTPGKGTRFLTANRLIIRDADGRPQYLLAVVEDVTERRRSNERIAYLAHYDSLTDLPNRVLFREKLEQALEWISPGHRLAVLYLDLDNFKTVNDTLGHPVGDELLKMAATRLRGCLRHGDVVARLGGDEFAIIQTAITDPMDVIDLVSRIQEAVQQPGEAAGHQLATAASIGIAIAPDDGTDPDQLLKNADMAMYGAKSDGRGTYRFFESEMDARVKAQRALEFDLREAIMCEALEVHYQPVVRLDTREIVGCEALLRWWHRDRGAVSPAEFIPLAEEVGLIGVLGEWVLRTACREAAGWPAHIRVAVNISPVQFRGGNLAELVEEILAASGLAPERLELEITESALLRDDEMVLAVLHRLRQRGVRIVMDDFGTGYSSLSYLQRFPFDKIKIDRSFVADVGRTTDALAIVQAVVAIANSRDIATTAEGVETETQVEALRLLGCREFQGYLFSPARPSGEVRELLKRRAGRSSAA